MSEKQLPKQTTCHKLFVNKKVFIKRMSQTAQVGRPVGEKWGELCRGGLVGCFSPPPSCCCPETELASLHRGKPEKMRTFWNNLLHTPKEDYKATPHVCLCQPTTYGPGWLLCNSTGSKGGDSPFPIPSSSFSSFCAFSLLHIFTNISFVGTEMQSGDH